MINLLKYKNLLSLSILIILLLGSNNIYAYSIEEDTIYYSIDSLDSELDTLDTSETTIDESGIDTEGDNPWLWNVNYFGKSLLLVNALTIISLSAILIMLVLLTLILLNRARIEREERLKQYLLEKYQVLILNYLFEDSGNEEFHQIASDKYRRQILIDTIIDVSVNLKGESDTKLKKLFIDLNLDKDAVTKAYSKKWHVKIKGFKELAFMNLKNANDEIYKSLQSKNHILRMEAQIALVRLSEKDPFEWLYFQVRPFSLWEQITLHSMLIQHDIKEPYFSKWLDSPNYTVVLFALRMIKEYKQHNDEDAIMNVLHHENEKVRQLAVEVCGDLRIKESALILKSKYKFEIFAIQLEIIKTLGKIADVAMLEYLKYILDTEGNVQIQIEATKAIEALGDVGIKALNELMASEYKNYKIVIRNVLDKKIV